MMPFAERKVTNICIGVENVLGTDTYLDLAAETLIDMAIAGQKEACATMLKGIAREAQSIQIANGSRILMWTGHDVNKAEFVMHFPGCESISIWEVR